MDISKDINIGVYGIGSFGFALLKHLSNSGYPGLKISAYDRSREVREALNDNRIHPYFHGFKKISNNINFVSSPRELVSNIDILVLAISSEGTRDVLRKIKPHINKHVAIVNSAKALDFETGKRLSELVNEELEGLDFSYSVLAGGTIAKDLFLHEPLGADLASSNKKDLKVLTEVFESSNLSIYPTNDLLGTEYAGALKNVVAIIAGIIKGLGFSYGSETHIISRVADSLAGICIDMGASKRTFSIGSQCWGNDLWMSCTGNTRNKEFGVLIGKGIPVSEAVEEMRQRHKTVEGLSTVKVLYKLPEFKDSSLIKGLNDLLIQRKTDIQEFKDILWKRV